MKKIFILLAAAVAALSSCVEENALAPETKEGNVTIKAVSADSKTLLDGTDVVWENTDKIAVVLDDKDVTTVEFSVKGEANGANATFTGTIEPELEYTSAYAVYPASAVVDGVVSHTLPEVQTGVVTSGMNLSSALLDAAQLQAGEAVGTFHNALVLLQVVVPAGMQEISLTSDEYLVGPTDFYVTNGVLSRKTVLESATVTLKTGSELTAGTHSLLVYPVKGGLTINMKGTDGTEFTKFVNTPKFEASKYYTLDFTKVFNMQTTEVMAASPAGEELVVPIVSVNDYEYSVSVEGNPDWITYTLPTKGFHGEEIVFNVKKNDSGVERSANVTISWGDESTRTFTITQKALFMDFVEDAEGNPIQWEETFGVYANESDATPVNTYKNIFTIELSDDFSKGTYKVNNMFVYNNTYSGNVGGTYYANYVDGVFTVIKNDSGYPFENNTVALTYDETEKTFTASSPIQFGYKFDAKYLTNGGFIKGYTAAVKVEEEPKPEQPSEDPIAGTWTLTAGEMGTGSGFGQTDISLAGKAMVISGSAGSYTIETIGDENYSLSVQLVGNVLSGSKNGSNFVLEYDSQANTLTQSGEFISWAAPAVKNIVATKQGGAIVVDPEGTYDATWVCYGGNSSSTTKFGDITEVVTITKKDDSENEYNITNMFTASNMGVPSTSYTATFSESILTVHLTTGDIDLNVTADGLSYIHSSDSDFPKVHEWNYYTNKYVAIKR